MYSLCFALGAVQVVSLCLAEQRDNDGNDAVSFLQLSTHVTTNGRGITSTGKGHAINSADLTQVTSPYTEEDDWWAFKHCSARGALSETNIGSRKPVMWVHLHKAAGTAICCEARRREKVVAPAANCNRGLDDWQKWPQVADGPFTTCEMRSSYMQEKGFTWGAIERWLERGDLCPDQFVYATLLRHPMKTMMSVVNYEHAFDGDAQPMKWVWSVINCIGGGMCQEKQWYLFDNFMVRTFSGVGHKVPPGGINSSHLQAAIEVIRSFDLVMLMDHMNDPRTFKAYGRAIGWSFPLDDSGMSDNINGANHELTFEPEVKQNLKDINAQDIAFFESVTRTFYP